MVKPGSPSARRGSARRDEARHLAEQYLVLYDEGYAPPLDEYLEGLPDELREPTFRAIDEALANRGLEDEDHLLPRAEVVVPEAKDAPSFGDRWVRYAARLVPRDVRHAFLKELLARREELRHSAPRFVVELSTLRRLMDGAAQHAPLQEVDPESEPSYAALAVWVAWRIAGPTLLFGLLAGHAGLAVCGGAFLLAAIAGFIAFAVRRDVRWSPERVQLVNGVAGGALIAVGLTAAYTAIAVVVVGLGLVAGSGGVASAGVEALLHLLVGTIAAICAAGWTPEPWYPRHLLQLRQY